MWPGVLSVSKTDFKPNAMAVVHAHKNLVNKYISSLAREDERRKKEAAEAQENEAAENQD